MILYHGTPETIKQLDTGCVLDFCLTDNRTAAASYGENVHEFQLNWDAKIASEHDVREFFEADGWYEGMPTYEILDHSAARAALAAAGFDGAEFNDSYECGQMTTTRVFRAEMLTLIEITTEN